MSSREQTFAWYAGPYAFLEECAARFGDTFTLDIKGWGPTVCFAHPTAIRDLFAAPPSTLCAGRANEILRPALGAQSVIVLDESAHLAQRRQLMPVFHGRHLRSWGAAIQTIARDAVDHWLKVGAGEARPLSEVLLDVSRDVILDVVFGVDRVDSNRDRLKRAVGDLLAAVGTTVQSSDVARARSALDLVLYEEFARRRAAPMGGQDVLGALLEDPGDASDQALSDQLVTLLMAGHETTAMSLAWALVEIEGHPEVLSRLRAEIADATAVETLPYLNAVCKEVLRLRPVVPAVARWVARPTTIGGWILPAGLHAAACIYLAHRRADVYPEPTLFRPERFLGTEPSAAEYLPFGGGVRRCVGMAFALFEMKVVLATILTMANLKSANRRPWAAVRHSVCVAPSEGTRMIMTSIRGEEE